MSQYWTGTNIFIDLYCAEKYYANLGFSKKDVLDKIKREEILVGKTSFNLKYPGRIPGTFAVNREGRFLILSD